MDRVEVAWRARAAGRIAVERARTRLSRPKWNRHDLAPALARWPELAAVHRALAAGRWSDAQRGLSVHFGTAPQRFVIHPAMKESVANRIRAAFPERAPQAAARADRIVAGEYDLLGYAGLRFSRPASPSPVGSAALPAWNYDPVHDRCAPQAFWSTVPF